MPHLRSVKKKTENREYRNVTTTKNNLHVILSLSLFFVLLQVRLLFLLHPTERALIMCGHHFGRNPSKLNYVVKPDSASQGLKWARKGFQLRYAGLHRSSYIRQEIVACSVPNPVHTDLQKLCVFSKY
jgi:hypothetical protein